MKRKRIENDNLRFWCCMAAVLCFLISLCFDSFCTIKECTSSLMAFGVGWFSMFGGSGICWLANPLLIVGFILTFKGWRYSILFSFLGMILCISFLHFDTVLQNEAGPEQRIVTYGLGYWLWTSSAILLFLCNLLLKKPNVIPNDQF